MKRGYRLFRSWAKCTEIRLYDKLKDGLLYVLLTVATDEQQSRGFPPFNANYMDYIYIYIYWEASPEVEALDEEYSDARQTRKLRRHIRIPKILSNAAVPQAATYTMPLANPATNVSNCDGSPTLCLTEVCNIATLQTCLRHTNAALVEKPGDTSGGESVT